MVDNQNQNIPQVGMIRDVHPDNLQNTQYSFAMNAVSDSRDGSIMKRMNEPSTIKDFEFGDYKVVGYKNDYDSNVTYFFITNPNDKTSKLVSMSFYGRLNPIDYDGKFEDNPSRYEPIYGRESYKIILEDDATDPCLNFSLAYPIKTIEIKQEKCGKCIYWTDGYNPPRYVDLTKALEPDSFGNIWYSFHGFKICDAGFDNDEFMKENGCVLACEKLRIFPLLDTPCLYPEVIENGGSLRCGVYQFCIALCDQFGNEQTNYHSLTNPIYIFDQNNILVKDGKWGERTQLGIRLSVNYLDKQASHYKIGVIQNTVGFNGEAQPSHTFKIEGIHPLTEKTVYYFSDLEAEDTTLAHLSAIRPVYKTSRGVATSSNRLLQYGLTQEAEWNLQPVCSLLGHFLKWQYQVASEDLYKDGASCSKYAGYMRDEVYPFAISFVTKEGYRTPVFTMIPPPARKDMLEDYSKHDVQVESVLAYVPNCVGNDRSKKWQFYNTAEKPGVKAIDDDGCKNEVYIPREQYVESIYFTWNKKGIDLMLVPNSSFNSGYDPLQWAINNIGTVCDNTDLTPDNNYLCQQINKEDDGIETPVFPEECDAPKRDRSRDVTTLVQSSMSNVQYEFSYLELQDMKKIVVADMYQEESAYQVYAKGAYLFGEYDTAKIWNGYTGEVMEDTVLEWVDKSLEYIAKDEATYSNVSASLALLNVGEARRLRQTAVCSSGCSPRDAIVNPTSYNGLLYQLLLSREYGPTIYLMRGNPDGKGTDSNYRDARKGFKTGQGDSGFAHNWIKYIIPMTNDLTMGNEFNTGLKGEIWGDNEFDYVADFENDDTTSTTPNGELWAGDSVCTGFKFHPNVSKTAKWVRLDKPETWEGQKDESLYVEYGGNNTIVVNTVSDSSMSNYVRITCFSDEKGTKLSKNIFDNELNKDIILWKSGSSIVIRYTSYLRTVLKASDFGANGSIYIAVDTQMCMFQYTLGNHSYGNGNDALYFIFGSVATGITPGPFHLAIREKEIEYVHLKTDGLALRRQAYFYSTCRSCGDTPIDCDPRDPSTGDINYGNFGYWESIEKYPANFELYDSSRMKIDTSKMTDGKKAVIDELSKYYGPAKIDKDGLSYFDGNTPEYPEATTTFCQQPIRHYLFPDNTMAPFCSSDTASGQNKCFIYPLGVKIDPETVNAFLDIAVDSKLITQEQRDMVDGFELYRGDRRLNKSVLGTGLGFDMYKYNDDNNRESWFPNFPYNTLGENSLIYADNGRSSFIQHPYGSDGNNMFSFCSPDYYFAKPEIGTELRIEGYQYGLAEGIYTEVEDYPKYVLLGPASYAYARKMALWQSVADTAYEVGMILQTIAQAWSGGLIGGIIGSIVGTVGLGLTIARISMNTLQRYGRYKNEWLSILQTRGVPDNFAFYYSSVGYYNSFMPVASNDVESNSLRGVFASKFLGPGMFSLVTPGSKEGEVSNVVINNRDRESSILLALGDPKYKLNYNGAYKSYDNSRFVDGQGMLLDVVSGPVKQKGVRSSFIASPYMKIKRYIPNQYGSIDNINWLSVGYCGKIDGRGDDEAIDFYGGDIFISRFSLKRKFPLFHTTAWGTTDLLPFALNDYRNIGFPRYFLDYETKEGSELQLSTVFPKQDGGATAVTHPYVESAYELAGLYGDWYLKGRMTLYSYGIPQFLVESEINCNFRLKGVEMHEQFYPAIGDYTRWTQQKNVPIHVDNTYMISPIYQSRNTIGFKRLPDTYEKKFWDCAAQKPNGVIWSREDLSENSMTDPWLFYKPVDYHEFPSKNGRLIHMKGIESDIIMARFDNQVGMYNTVDVLKERVDPNTYNEMGTGGLFQGRPMEYNKTDLGYTGSQSTEMVSTEYGHLWVDAKRGYVFMVQPNGSGLRPVHPGISNWLKEYMPFHILKYNIINTNTGEPMTYEDVDNKFIGLGLSLGWDNRFKRVFVTKKDYIPTRTPSSYSYKDAKFFYNGIEVSLHDKQYFEDVSFTIAYSMDNQGWLSYYSFMPDYYIERHNYFQSGKNFSDDMNELGIWSHLLTTKSYQVFYGKLYPFIIEMPILEQYIHKVIQNVSYRMEARRYMNDIDYAVKRSVGFNKAWIYSDRNHSGLLHLVPEEKNNMYQKLNYPRIALDESASYIIETEDQDEHRFNDFFNRVKDDMNGIPLWVKDRNDINREVNVDAIYYRSVWKDRIRGDWFLVRYSNDKESQFKLIFRWNSNEEKVYK